MSLRLYGPHLLSRKFKNTHAHIHTCTHTHCVMGATESLYLFWPILKLYYYKYLRAAAQRVAEIRLLVKSNYHPQSNTVMMQMNYRCKLQFFQT